MYALFASAALALVTIPPSQQAPAQTVQPAATAPVVAVANASRRHSRPERVALAIPAGSSYDDAAQQQIDLHVLLPARSGDGGG
jgi:hypothetical protein